MERPQQRKLLRMMARHGIAECDYSGPGVHVSLVIEGKLHPEILCPQACIFLHAHPADPAKAKFPRRVRKGETIAYLRVGAVLLPLKANEDAWLPTPMIDHGAIAGYGDVLF